MAKHWDSFLSYCEYKQYITLRNEFQMNEYC